MEFKIHWILALICLLVIYLILNGITKELTPSNYVLNTYMYIILAILMVGVVWTTSREYNLMQNFGTKELYFIIVMSFVTLYATLATPKDQSIKKHIAWTAFVVCIGIMCYRTYDQNVKNNTLTKILGTLLVVMGALSYAAYTLPIDTFKSWEKPLTYVLIGLIVVELCELIFSDIRTEDFITRQKIYDWIAIALFSGFVIYDTQKIIKDGIDKSAICKLPVQLNSMQSNLVAECADYPKASLGLFLDMANLFLRSSRRINSG